VPSTEKYYIDRSRNKLIKNMFRWCALSTAISAAMIPVYFMSKPANEVHARLRAYHRLYLAIPVLVQCSGMLVTCTPRVLSRTATLQLEILSLLTMLVPSIFIVLMDTHYLAKMIKVDPADVGRSMSDSRILLAMALMLAVGHVMIRIRWLILVPLEIVVILLYSFCVFVLGSPEGFTNSVGNIIMFMALTVSTALGKRQLESYERLSFLSFNAEKGRRFETEFKLAKLHHRAQEAGVQFADKESLPSTTATDRAFNQAGVELQHSLIELGETEDWLIQLHELNLLPDSILGHGGFGIVMTGLFHGNLCGCEGHQGSLGCSPCDS